MQARRMTQDTMLQLLIVRGHASGSQRLAKYARDAIEGQFTIRPAGPQGASARASRRQHQRSSATALIGAF
jgi:hypothetical protein